ncbi:response regulator [Angustibacter aerolatus]|uniref:DNA-binding response regulator n=1 Tax=Angustibacter aerolatus TaxID=1162965 RepID=A0ABQ6JIQ0_9ACTN|nr:response regulator transcription factor [Angustibacter aerolatus]GMA87622.1 DNA-binding response regulator [Angustibacter aerolatus]
MTIRVALVDDQALVRAGFRMVIDSQPDLRVVAEAGDGQQAVEALAALSPQDRADVVLMDVRMPVLDGLQATPLVLALPDPPRVVVLTTFAMDDYVVQAIAGGASGFLLKDAEPEDLLAAIRTVHGGDAVIAARATSALLRHVGPLLSAGTAAARGESAPTDPAGRALVDRLTAREREVLVLMTYGASNQEIAQRLVVSETTVKTHVGRVLAKTGSRDRVQAVVLAFRCGLVGADDLLRDATS